MKETLIRSLLAVVLISLGASAYEADADHGAELANAAWAGAMDSSLPPPLEDIPEIYENRPFPKGFKNDQYWHSDAPQKDTAMEGDEIHYYMTTISQLVQQLEDVEVIKELRLKLHGAVEGPMLGQRLLWYAASLGHAPLMEYLLEYKDDTIDVDGSPYGDSNDLWRMVHHTAKMGMNSCLNILIKGGADIEAPLQDGKTPLDMAVGSTAEGWFSMNKAPIHPFGQGEYLEVVKSLMAYNPEVSQNTMNDAFDNKNLEIIRMLIEKSNFDCDVPFGELRDTCLHRAADTMRFLVSISKVLTGHTNYNWWAKRGGEEAMLQYQGEKMMAVDMIGFNVTDGMLSSDEKTINHEVFREAVFRWNLPLVEYVISLGVDVNQRDVNGNTPLHIAAGFGDFVAVEALLNAKAESDILNNDGVSALEVAAFGNHIKAQEVLLRYGADISVLERHTFYGDENSVEVNCRENGSCDKVYYHARYSDESRANRKNILEKEESGGWATYTKEDIDLDYCDVDVRPGLTREEFMEEYFIPRKPVIIPNHTDDWPAMKKWTKDYFVSEVSDLPIKTFLNKPDMSLPVSEETTFSKYMKYLNESSGTDDYPLWAVDYSTPTKLWEEDCTGFIDFIEPAIRDRGDYMHKIPQFMIAPAYMGASPHYHYTAGNVVMFGKKRWFLFPPDTSFYSTVHIHDWTTNELPKLQGRNQPLQCAQNAGDMLFVPRMWGHGVIYPKETIGLAFLFES